MSDKLFFEIIWSKEFNQNPTKKIAVKIMKSNLKKGLEKALKDLDEKCEVRVFEN